MELTVYNLDKKSGITNDNIIELLNIISNKLKLDMQSCQIIFVGDEKLRSMHQEYLNDPDYTDVMTFNLGGETIEAEIYISIERVEENARTFGVSVANEIFRNVIHGLLHLKGYTDKNESEKSLMKQKEEELLNQIQII